MKTIKIESSFWVGDIVYGIVAEHVEPEKLSYSISKFVVTEIITTPENGPVKMYTIENVDSGRKFRCADDEVTKSYDEAAKQYFEDCSNHCVAVFGGKIYVCPRAGIFDIKNIYKPEKDEIINLNTETNPNILRKKLKSFYSREGFSACKYCTVLKDREHDRILPAQQIK